MLNFFEKRKKLGRLIKFISNIESLSQNIQLW